MTLDYEPDQELEAAGYTVPYPNDPFEMRSGPFYIGFEADGSTVVALRAGENQCNSNGVVHGGCLMTLADLAVCYEAIGGDEALRSLTVSLTANFLAPAERGTILRAFPQVNRRTKRMAFVDTRIMVGDTCVFTASAVIRVIPRG
jgi:acyl-coenzyme A thioesterase 13